MDISPNEDRSRWDRIVLFHIFLMMFLNKYGLDHQKTDKAKFADVVKNVVNAQLFFENTLKLINNFIISTKDYIFLMDLFNSTK